MAFKVKRVLEHVEPGQVDIYGQELNFEYRPGLLDKALIRRLQQLERLEAEERRAVETAREEWEEGGQEGDPPQMGTPALDEVVATAQALLVSWEVEDENGVAIDIKELPAAVDSGRVPLIVLYRVFAGAIKMTETPKGKKRR